MQFRSHLPFRSGLFQRIFLLAATLLLCGCQTSRRDSSIASDWQPHYLYNREAEPSSLIVEVDAVEGSIPSEELLETIRQFLELHCTKSAGISVRLSTIIPRSVAKGKRPKSLALANMDQAIGGATSSAYLYLLFYDNRALSNDADYRNSSYGILPYPGIIFINTTASRLNAIYHSSMLRSIVLHELGHALGQCSNSAHGDGFHCKDKRCLMSAHVEFRVSRFFLARDPWGNKELCPDCLRDLSNRPTASLDVYFRGPFFVQRREGYQIVTLPDVLHIHVGEDDITDEELEMVRAKAIKFSVLPQPGLRYYFNDFDPNAHTAALRLLSQEKQPLLKQAAAWCFEQIALEISSGKLQPTPDLILSASEFPELQRKLEEGAYSLKTENGLNAHSSSQK